MLKSFKIAFKITNSNLMIASSLLLFLILLNIYLSIAQNAVKALPSLILLIVTTYLMISAFLGGWFYVIKVAVKNFFEDDSTPETPNLLKNFPIGIGEYFNSFLVFVAMFLILLSGILIVATLLGVHYIGDIGISAKEFKTAIESSVAMQALIENLSKEQLIKLSAWNFLYVSAMSLMSLLTFLWIPQILNKTKNVFYAFFKSIALMFKKPYFLLLFIYILVINFILAIINNLSMINPFFYFFITLIYFYFIVYVVILIFTYYEETIRTKTESDSDSGSDSFGQE